MDGQTLRGRLAAAYGTPLEGVSLDWNEERDSAAISLADRIAPMLGAPLPGAATANVDPPIGPPWPRWAATAGSGSAESVRAVVEWAAARGADFSAIEIRTSPEGNRSVFAKKHLWRQDRVMFVPRALMIIDEDLDRSEVGARLAEGRGDFDSLHTPFATWLALERARGDSPWRTYFQSLPADPDLPAFRDAAELALLTDTAAVASAAGARRNLDEDHARVVALLGAEAPERAAMAWARAITSSRLFKLTIEGHDRRAMVPVADFFDHSDGDTTWRYDDAEGGLIITAARTIEEGEPIHLGYGSFPNAHFLTHYGFAVPDNADDVALLLFPPAADPLRDVIAACLWDQPLSAPVELEVNTRIEGGMRRALSLARLRNASYREILLSNDRGRFEERSYLWLHGDHDRAALEMIADAARAARARIEDQAPIAEDASPWERTCAVVRAGERAIHDAVIALRERAEPYIADPTPWQWRHAAVSMDILSRYADCLVRSYILMIADELPR
ncbi:MAG TPA: SET domain-containing protein [Kofleriaceae bacterium]|nr:SET domain-containing protein [Kofleriaceae bacterium]